MYLTVIKDNVVNVRSELNAFAVDGNQSREVSLAITKLDEATLWLERSIEIHDNQSTTTTPDKGETVTPPEG